MKVGNLIYCTYSQRYYLIVAEIMFNDKEAWKILTDDGKYDHLLRARLWPKFWKVVA